MYTNDLLEFKKYTLFMSYFVLPRFLKLYLKALRQSATVQKEFSLEN